MTVQLGLFDDDSEDEIRVRLPEAARKAIGEGMDRADRGASEEWKDEVRNIILTVAREKDFLTVDDILDYIDAHPIAHDTPNLSALGPLMKEAASIGFIAFSGKVQRSRRAVKHGITHRIWQSKVRSTI